MAEKSKISWTHSTFNPWRGCTKVSPACKYCYADTLSQRNPATLGVWGDNGTRVVAAESMWRQPSKWNKNATERQRVFCSSLADVFEDWRGYMVDSKGRILYRNRMEDTNGWFSGREPDVDEHHVTMSDVRERLFNVIDTTPNLDWLLLTKRPENIQRFWPVARTYIPEMLKHGQSRENVWLGTTVENQEYADKRIPELLRCHNLAPVLFLSVEPMLGPVDLSNYLRQPWMPTKIVKPHSVPVEYMDVPTIHWVIVGTESGAGRRPMDLTWARSLRDQCKAAGTAFFVKQLEINGKVTDDINEFPEDLRIQEFPKVGHSVQNA